MDLADKIKPALNIQPVKELSTEEFQHSLYEYYEEKGILSNLRAHLRAQMVNVLKETSLGKAILSKKHEISPKLQAQNLLIAEYLLQRNYHYTLSVLSSEVPLNNAFPPMSFDEFKSKNATFQFNETDMTDILEAIGLNRQPNLAKKISYRYHLQGKESLLTCIIQSIPGLLEESNLSKQENIKSWLSKHDIDSLNLESMISLLKATGVSIDIILQICELVKDAIVNEVKNLNRLKDIQVSKMKKQMSNEAACKMKKYKDKFAKMEVFYKEEKYRLEKELQATKDNLKDRTNQVQTKYDNIKELNAHIAGLETRLKHQELALLSKEYTLQQRQEYLENKQKVIDQQFEDLKLISRSQQSLPVIDTCEKRDKQTGVRTEMKRISTESKETETKIIRQSSAGIETTDDLHDELKEENVHLKRASVEMQSTIEKLKDQNISYQSKIQELLLRTNSLLAQLETRTNDTRRYLSLHQSRIPSYHGGGEEGRSVSPSPRLPRDSRRKKTQPSLPLYQLSSSDEISPTDEVLEEAKARLQELELESAQIDYHFDRLPKTTLRTADSNAASIIQSFQSNVGLLRESLTKLFSKETRHCSTPESAQSEANILIHESKNFVNIEEEVEEPLDDGLEEANIIFEECVEVMVKSTNNEMNLRGCHICPDDEVVVCDDNDDDVYNSTTSSGMIINTSISTVDVSADCARSSSMCEWMDID